MCRLAAYLGSPVSLQRFLIDPPHSLVQQSWAPREMDEAVLNADGFGFGWYPEPAKPVTYLSTQPVWSDVNLTGLAGSLISPLWMGYVRSATPGQMTSLGNTQPFRFNHLLFMHNGYIKDFNGERRTRFHQYLRPEIQADINGNTDSEHLFAVLRQQIADQPDAGFPEILANTLQQIKSIIKNDTVLLNIIVSDGKSIYAVKHAINGQCPSLYFSLTDEMFPDAVVVASEQLTTDSAWQPVPESSIMIFSGESEPETISI